MLKVEEVKSNINEVETKPEEIFSLQNEKKAPAPVTQELPFVTQVMKKDKTPSTPPTTQKIDLDLLKLIKTDKKSNNDEIGKQRSKKIEDDISKKFEETLSGLGLGLNAKSTSSQTSSSMSKPSSPAVSKGKNVSEPVKQPEPPVKITPPSIEKSGPADEADEVGGYDILGLIARGGMAEIYKAKKKGVKGFEKLIALKKILGGYGGDDKYIEMFVDEAKIAAQLSHPNIVQIYDLGKKDDYYFIAMEYVNGKDLRDILHRLSEANTLMPEELAIFLINKILNALNYAHSARDSNGVPLDIVHRDVSPPNILVSYDGNIKLTDFGVSKASIKLHHTVAGALKGKLLYMSPEQARGDVSIDYRSDLYSVAIILFELLTGQKLFLGTSEIGTLKKVQDGRILKPSDIKKEINSQLEGILLKSLSKNPDDRYQKASEMIKALDAYMLSNFNNIPEVSHFCHFMYTLFKDDINKEGIKLNLRPIPYPIKRKPPVVAQPSAPPAQPTDFSSKSSEPVESLDIK
jgi:serine/threonine protein kinase